VPLSRQGRLMASCQNETILPFLHDTVPDEQFPAEGKVYTEAPKGFVGLAGESRSGDANGQWFRVLAAGGTNLVTLKPGVFATTPNPILGANPPKSKRPPINTDVACETQEGPDLRTKPGAPPEQQQVDTSSALYKERLAQARGEAIEWLEKQLKIEGLDKLLSIAEDDATPGLIDRVAGTAGGLRP
jgi:phospholipid/cholesterol/gamma-HCH transport system substrate-binding protein